MLDLYNEILKNNKLNTTEKTVLMYLTSIATESEASMSLIELSDSVNVTKPTLIKSLHSLEEKNMISKYNDGGRYSKNIYKINNN